MKKYKIIFLALCALFIAGCSSVQQTKSPTETLKALSEASKKKDVESIKQKVSKGTLELLEQSAKRENKSVDELLAQENNAPFEELPETRNEKITGDTATVEVKNNVSGGYETIPFVKENGEWKVAIDKFMEDIMKRATEEMKNMPANPASPNAPEAESGTPEANKK